MTTPYPNDEHDCELGCEGCYAPTPVRVNRDGWCADCRVINALEGHLEDGAR